jgi:uncharacterized LabA/DUF88 family protein
VPDPKSRIAVLIDADNTSARYITDLLEEVARYGTPTVRRAYGDFTMPQLSGWKAVLNPNAIQPVQQFAYTTGKNSTDSALIIDAMDLLYSNTLDAFAIVSSDSDFTRLVTRLRESGMTVYGFGQAKTPESLVRACDRFIYLEVLGASDDDEPPVPARDPEDPELRRMLLKAIDAASHEDGWASLAEVGNYLTKSHASFDPRNYGFAKLSTLSRSQPYLEVDVESPGARVRRRVTAQKSAAAKKSAKKTAPPPTKKAKPVRK